MAYQDWKIPTGFDFEKVYPDEEEKPKGDKEDKKRPKRRPPRPLPEGNTIIYQGNTNYYSSNTSWGGANNYAGLVTINNNLSLIDKNIRVLDNKLDVVVGKIDRIIDRISIQRGIKKGTAAKDGYPGHPDLEYARDPFTGDTIVRVVKPDGKMGSWRLAQEHYGSKKRAGNGDGGYTPGVPRVGSEKHATLMTILHAMARGGRPKPYSEGGATLLSNVDFSAGPGPVGSPNDFRTFEESDDNMPQMRPASEFQQRVAQQQYEASETPIAELTVSTKKEFKKVDSRLNDMAFQLANLSNMMLAGFAALGVTNLASLAGGAAAARAAGKGGLLKRAAGALTRRATMIPMAIGGALLGSSLMSPEAMAGDMTNDESGKGDGFGMGETAIAGVGGYFMYRTIRNTATKYTSTAERKRMAEKAYKRYLKRTGTAVIAQNATKWQRFIVYLQAAQPTLYRKIGMRLAAMGVLATVPVGGWIAAGVYLGMNALTIATLIGLWRSFESQTPEEQSMWDKFKATVADIFAPTEAEASVENPMTERSDLSFSAAGANPMGCTEPSMAGTGSVSEAMDFFMSKGWTREQAAGIVGNLQAESGPNLQIDAKGDGGKAYGIAQWHEPRQKLFQQVYGKPIQNATFREQLEFVNWELNNSEKAAGDMLRASRSAKEAAMIVDRNYERSAGSHTDRRVTNAENLMRAVENRPTIPTLDQMISDWSDKTGAPKFQSGMGNVGELTPAGRTSDLGAAGRQREQMISGPPSVTVMQPIVQGGTTVMAGNSTPPQSLPRADLRPSDSVLTSFNRDRWALA